MSSLTFAKHSRQAGTKEQSVGGHPAKGLRIGEPDDAFEREADRLADEIMAGRRLKRDWSISDIGVTAPLQRKCDCGGECDTCRQKNENTPKLQRKPLAPTEADVAPGIVHQVLNSPGQQLDKATRDFFEPRFGYDLSGVRVHSDSMAAESARAVNAAAYTVGNHVVFGSRGLSNSTYDGRKLLAHELVHTFQQNSVLPGRAVSAVSRPRLQRDGEITASTDLSGFTSRLESIIRTGGPVPTETRVIGAAIVDIPGYKGPKEIRAISSAATDVLGQGADVHHATAPTTRELSATRSIGGASLRREFPFSHVNDAEMKMFEEIRTNLPENATGRVHFLTYRVRQVNGKTVFEPIAACSGCTRATFEMGSYRGVTMVSHAATHPTGTVDLGGPVGGTQGTGGGAEPTEEGQGSAVRSTGSSEENVEGKPTRSIGSAEGAAEPGFTRALGFAALTFAAGVGTSLLQGEMREKIAEDLAKLPQPKRDKRAIWEFLNDPGTRSAVRLLDVMSKDIKPYTAEFQPQHTKIMATGLVELLAIAPMPSKTKEDIEKRLARLDALNEEMSGYQKRLSIVQDNLDALLAMEPQAKQTKAACDDLIAKLPTMFTVQAASASALGFVPVPDPDDYSKMDSNLSYLSSSIGMVFADAHSAKTVIDKAVQEADGFSASVSKLFNDEFNVLFSLVTKERATSSTAKPQRPPTQPRATAAAQQQGPQLLPTLAPVQQEQKWEPLPGAPGPSPFREVEAKKKDFAQEARDLIARGNAILSGSADAAKAEGFKSDEHVWRMKVESWQKQYEKKGPDTGPRAMDELLNSDEYGGRLKQIRQSLGG